MYYRHDLPYKYPEKSDEHMIIVKKKKEVIVDQDYPYISRGFWGWFKRTSFWIVANCLAIPAATIRHGLKIYGKKNYKKHKKEFKNGAITISNHVFMWDYLCVLKAIRPNMPYFPAWKTNLEGSNGVLIRWASGVPVPTENLRAMAKFNKSMEWVLQNDKWLHFFPEGSMWFYYPDIRPLKKAVFKYAYKYDKPIIPITMSFRPRKGIYKWFGKTPLVDLHIGEPLYINKDLPINEATEEIRTRAYKVMQEMNGITQDSPTYNVDQNIQTYKKTM